MTNEEIKAALARLYYCKTDFIVIQSGKKSSKVNGLYKPDTQEIILHNKNFTTDNQLMYTAIHELTHHILITEKGVKTQKAHSGIFWATFYDLIDKAVELKLYTQERSEETASLIAEAVEIQKKIIEAQKELGRKIGRPERFYAASLPFGKLRYIKLYRMSSSGLETECFMCGVSSA